MPGEVLYKVLRESEWREAQTRGIVVGSPDDLRDGFIHLSTREQLEGTLLRHFAGESGLIALEIAADRVGADLKWESSRGGALFPHLYGVLPLDAVVRTITLAPPHASADREHIERRAAMRHRTFGRTGIQVSEVIFGAGAVGGIVIHKDDAVKREAIRRALRGGINWIDTAAQYGNGKSEEALGWLLPEARAT